MELISNAQLELAYNFLQYTNQNIFLTGKAGTGKTTFLRNLKKNSPKRMVVVAPTGVAAINAGGVTIHSFFQLSFGPQIPGIKEQEVKRFSRNKINIIRSLDLLIIDEISMVRADILDGIDKVLRRFKNRYKPFGGTQLLMIGDLQQLAPVTKEDEWELLKDYYETSFFFSSLALKQSNFICIELIHIFRQSDIHFIELLNKVRENKLDKESLNELNARFIPRFNPHDNEGYITLTTHNFQSQQINSRKLNQLSTKSHVFTAIVKGEFPEFSYPTDFELELKVGAQVMFVKNDPEAEKRYYNGKIGKIKSIIDDIIEVECPNENETIELVPDEWKNYKYMLNETTQEIEEEVIGSFIQYPLKLAWAITIHKSQGLTFEKAIIDARDSFAHGQVYVALSRCKTLEGMVLSSPIADFSVKNDNSVAGFSAEVEKNQPGEAELEKSKKEFVYELLSELFDFKLIHRQIHYIQKFWDENSSSLMGNLNHQLNIITDKLNSEIITVATKFNVQINKLIFNDSITIDDQLFQERIKKASVYFDEKLTELITKPLSTASFSTDNKTIKKSLSEFIDRLKKDLAIKKACLDLCKEKFDIKSFLVVKSKAAIETPDFGKFGNTGESGYLASTNPDFYVKLIKWRASKATDLNTEISKIIPQKTLHEIVLNLPATRRELKEVKGMGGTRLKKFGKEILEMIIKYRKEKGMELPLEPEKEIAKTALNSQEISFELFRNNKSVVEIAQERQMAVSTIEGHLAHFVATGDLEIEKLVEPKKIKTIIAAIEHLNTRQMGPIKEFLSSDFTYSEIRFVIKHLDSEK